MNLYLCENHHKQASKYSVWTPTHFSIKPTTPWSTVQRYDTLKVPPCRCTEMQITWTYSTQVKSAVDTITIRGIFFHFFCEIYWIFNILLYREIISILAGNSRVAWKDSYERFFAKNKYIFFAVRLIRTKLLFTKVTTYVKAIQIKPNQLLQITFV